MPRTVAQNGKSVDQTEDKLQRHDAVDQAREEPLRDDRVLLDELREVIQPRRCEAPSSAWPYEL